MVVVVTVPVVVVAFTFTFAVVVALVVVIFSLFLSGRMMLMAWTLLCPCFAFRSFALLLDDANVILLHHVVGVWR